MSELAAYVTMILAADHSTGEWRGSGVALAAKMRCCERKGQQLLRSLQRKGYLVLPKTFPASGNYRISICKYFKQGARTCGLGRTGMRPILINRAHQDATIQEVSQNHQEGHPQEGNMRAFEELFAAYPDHRRSEWDAKLAWNGLPLVERDMQEIMAGLEAWKASAEWRREDGRYVPSLTKFIRERRWKIKPRKEHGKHRENIERTDQAAAEFLRNSKRMA